MSETGVTDFDVAETSEISRRSSHAYGKAGVRPTHRASAATYIPAMRQPVPQSLSDADLFASRSVPVHGFRTTDLSRKFARYRDLPACALCQALSLGNSRWHCPQHF